MKITPTTIPDVIIIEPDIHKDKRGFFIETYHEKRYRDVGIDVSFVQDNLSYSKKGVLRGLHYQSPNAQAKLIHVFHGEIFDVAVDIREESSTFGQWIGEILSENNKKQLYIPVGFAHGYCVLSASALVGYKCSTVYSPEGEKGICWNDPNLSIIWPLQNPLVSKKDSLLPKLNRKAMK